MGLPLLDAAVLLVLDDDDTDAELTPVEEFTADAEPPEDTAELEAAVLALDDALAPLGTRTVTSLLGDD